MVQRGKCPMGQSCPLQLLLQQSVPIFPMRTRTQRRRTPQRKPRAATKDVLNNRPPDARVPAKWRKYYDRLNDLRSEYLGRQQTLSRDANEESPAFSTHMADAGTDTYDRDFALGVLSSEQDALYEIEEALDRIRNGTYGSCELTRKPIPAERLEAIPWTRFTAAAEKELERDGQRRRTRLGTRETVAKVNASTEEPDEE